MPKRLVICCDGTWNTADQLRNGRGCPTNVIRIALSIAPEDPAGIAQRVYYHPGVGAIRWEHLVGGAFGVGLSANVMDAYRFLVDNYQEGDELYLFGFSRGAFTARSVAGLVRKCGVLRPENRGRIEEAYRLYRSWATQPRGMASTMFRSAYSYEPDICFIGVWDTVGALGIPPFGPTFLHGLLNRFNKRWSFHDTDLSTKVRAAYQALAIDEHRAAFKPTLWKQQPDAGPQQILEQVWFSGAHSDVGGGLPDTSISDIALLWMVANAQRHAIAVRADAFTTRATDTDDGDPDTTASFTVAPRADCLPHTHATASSPCHRLGTSHRPARRRQRRPPPTRRQHRRPAPRRPAHHLPVTDAQALPRRTRHAHTRNRPDYLSAHPAGAGPPR